VGLLAVGLGPGSFTGIRAGIAAAKGLALPRKLPLKGTGSFDALALTALPKMPRDCPQMCVLGDARRDEIYFAVYDHAGRRVKDCRIGALETLADEIHQPIWFVSSEIERYKSDLVALLGGFATVGDAPVFPSAAAVGWLAFHRFCDEGNRGDKDVEPMYLRTPQYKTIET
jgi:tRNA threonylcarbamoyl adenosine modification protein YeaZ